MINIATFSLIALDIIFLYNYIDVPKLKQSINKVLTKRHAQLSDASRHCLQSLANEMFVAELISKQVQRSPLFDSIIDEFIAGMSFMSDYSEVDDHCVQFLKACIEVGGAIAKAARVLQKDWIDVGMKVDVF